MTQHGPRDTETVLDARYTLTDKGWDAVGRPAPKPGGALAQVRAFHNAWGDTSTDELDPLALWEGLDRLLTRLEHAAGRLFVAPDGYDDPTIWLGAGPDDPHARAVMARTDANADGFDALAALIGGHQ